MKHQLDYFINYGDEKCVISNKDAQSLWLTSKLIYNPFNFNFKDRLFITNGNFRCPMIDVGFELGSEQWLLRKIVEFKSKTSGVYPDIDKDFISLGTYLGVGELDAILKYTINPRILDMFGSVELPFMWYRNGLHIDLKALEFASQVRYGVDALTLPNTATSDYIQYAGTNPKSHVLKAFLQMALALTSDESIVAELPLIMSRTYENASYANCRNLEADKGMFEGPSDSIKLRDLRNLLQHVYIPTSYMSFNVNASKGGAVTFLQTNLYKLTGVGNDWYNSCTSNKRTVRGVLVIGGFIKGIMYGAEILHHLYKLKPEYQETLLELCFKNSSNNYEDCTLLFTRNSEDALVFPIEIEEIIAENTPSERFMKIRNYIYKLLKDGTLAKCTEIYLSKFEDLLYKKITTMYDMGFPVMLTNLCQYASEYGLQRVHCKRILIMLDYIKKNGIDLKKDDEDANDKLELFGKHLGNLVDGCVDTTDIDSFLNLINEDAGVSDNSNTPEKPLTPREKKKPSNIDEISRALSVFNPEQYKYNVEEVESSEECKDEYDKIVESIDFLNRQLVKSIREIKVYNTGGKTPGKKSGKLDRKNLYKYRTSKDIFYENTYKVRECDPAFGILLDCSGSMYGDGIASGRFAMIVLHESLKQLGINHCIMGHTSRDFHQCNLQVFQHFKESVGYKVNRNYSLTKLESRGGNCDSGALHYMEWQLLKTHNRDKICLIFSDGEPTECTDVELKDKVREMESKGIIVIGIGVNFDEIKEYYPRNANGKNLKEMFDIIAEILKQYVLDKKD